MSQTSSSSPSTSDAPKRAWWREPMVWLVIGGPAVVVVASFITLGIAVRYPDPVIETRVPAADDLDARAASMLPAVQGRNHAATVSGARPSEAPSGK